MPLRTIPFGYEVADSKKVVKESEAKIVQQVFDRYIFGDTFKKIADSLTEQGVTYHLDNKTWNKNMISRMVDDVRYIGNEEYPLIVTPEKFELANRKRADKSAKKAKLPDITELIKSKLVCAECGKPFTRRDKWKTREKWYCSCGCKTLVYLDDKKLFSEINKTMNKAVSESTGEYEESTFIPNAEVQKEENMINTFLEQIRNDYNVQIKIILDCASKKFDCCHMHYNKALDEMIRQAYFEEQKKNDCLVQESLIEKTIDQFFVNQNGTVGLVLCSGMRINCA